MLVKVCKHGNSLSIRLGAYVTRTARIKCGDWVDVVLLSSGEIRIKPKTGPEPLEADGEAAPTDGHGEAVPAEGPADGHAAASHEADAHGADAGHAAEAAPPC